MSTMMDLSNMPQPGDPSLLPDIKLGAMIIDRSGSTQPVAHLIMFGQNVGLQELVNFPKNEGSYLAQYLFNGTWSELHPLKHVSQAVKLSVTNYQSSGGTLFYRTILDVTDRLEEVAELYRQHNYKVTTVYGIFTDNDGDNASNAGPGDVGNRVRALLNTEKAKFFYCGMGGASADYHRDIALQMGILPDYVYVIDPDMDEQQFGREIRHAFGMYSHLMAAV